MGQPKNTDFFHLHILKFLFLDPAETTKWIITVQIAVVGCAFGALAFSGDLTGLINLLILPLSCRNYTII